MKPFPLKQCVQALCVLSAGGVLIACSSLPGTSAQSLKAATAATLSSCEALMGDWKWPNTRLESVVRVAEGTVTQGGKAVPAHCLVKGRMHERKGSDGRDYAIGFEMRLPQAWNGRFYYQGNGGLWVGAAGTAGLRLPGGAKAHAHGQAAHWGRLRQRA